MAMLFWIDVIFHEINVKSILANQTIRDSSIKNDKRPVLNVNLDSMCQSLSNMDWWVLLDDSLT